MSYCYCAGLGLTLGLPQAPWTTCLSLCTINLFHQQWNSNHHSYIQETRYWATRDSTISSKYCNKQLRVNNVFYRLQSCLILRILYWINVTLHVCSWSKTVKSLLNSRFYCMKQYAYSINFLAYGSVHKNSWSSRFLPSWVCGQPKGFSQQNNNTLGQPVIFHISTIGTGHDMHLSELLVLISVEKNLMQVDGINVITGPAQQIFKCLAVTTYLSLPVFEILLPHRSINWCCEDCAFYVLWPF